MLGGEPKGYKPAEAAQHSKRLSCRNAFLELYMVDGNSGSKARSVLRLYLHLDQQLRIK